MACRHSIQLLKQLHFQHIKSLFCDVTVRVSGGQSFPAHLCLLAACSAKLHSLALSASSQNSQHMTKSLIVLDMLTARGFQPVLEFIYTGSLQLTVENIDEVFAAARYLDLCDVIESCSQVYRGISTLDVCSLKNRNCGCEKDNSLERYVVKNSIEKTKNERVMKLSLCRVKSMQTEESNFIDGLSTSEDISSAQPSHCKQQFDAVDASVCHGKKEDSHSTIKSSHVIKCAGQERDQDQAEIQQPPSYQNRPETGRAPGPDQDESANYVSNKVQPQRSCSVARKRRTTRSRRKKLRSKRGEVNSSGEKDSMPDASEFAKPKDGIVEDLSSGDHSFDKPEQSKVVPDEVAEAEVPSVSRVGGKLFCSVCGKCCARGSSLTRHLRVHSMTVFPCSSCEMTFWNPSAYKRHAIATHGSKRVFACSFSGCKFASDRLSNVDRHSVIHSDVRDHSCSRCGQTFAQDTGLASHLRSCTETRSYLCDLCGAAFNHLHSMRSHRRIHTGEKPFRCVECGANFADYRNLKRHRRIHSDAFPYECVVCAQKFRHSNSLKSHHLGCHQIIFSRSSRRQENT